MTGEDYPSRIREAGHPAARQRAVLISRSSFRTGSEATLARSWVSVFSAEVTRIYAVRNWTGQSCKQVKDERGWAGFQVRSDLAIRRHQALVNCAFSFCWAAWFACPAPRDATPPAAQASGGERGSRTSRAARAGPGAAGRPRLAGPVDQAAALVGRPGQLGRPRGSGSSDVRCGCGSSPRGRAGAGGVAVPRHPGGARGRGGHQP